MSDGHTIDLNINDLCKVMLEKDIELEQLRLIAKEQHDLLKVLDQKITMDAGLQGIRGAPASGSPADKVKKIIARYESLNDR